jgi:hypothetical protein
LGKTARLFIIFLIGVFIIPQVHAQTTNIIDVEYPKNSVFDIEQRTADPPLIVKATVTYSDARAGYVLGTGIFDLTTGNLVAGTSSASPRPCASEQAEYAGCVVQLTETSGIEHTTFSLSQPQPIMNLALVAGFFDTNRKEVQSSLSDFEFTIRLTTALALQMNLPSNVEVTVDNSVQSNGSVRLKLVVGTHHLSVPDTVQIDNETRLKFKEWSDGGTQPNRTVLLNHDVTLTANYTTQYLLAIESAPVNATGTGWYDQGTLASFSVPSLREPMPSVLGILGGLWRFQGWYENGEMLSAARDGSITMNGAHTLMAHWYRDYALPLTIIGLICAAVASLATVGLRNRRKTRRKRRRARARKRNTARTNRKNQRR